MSSGLIDSGLINGLINVVVMEAVAVVQQGLSLSVLTIQNLNSISPPVQTPVLDRLGQVLFPDIFRTFKISDSASYLQDASISPSREALNKMSCRQG
jgi:hypothetical protein